MRGPGLLAALAVAACSTTGSAPVPEPRAGPLPLPLLPVSLDDTADYSDLEPLGRAIGNRRIVLLGENGHGVAEFTMLKSRLIRYLHQRKGFDLVVFESGFYECHRAGDSLLSRSARDAFRGCLSYVFEHAELLPLFEYFRSHRESAVALGFAGMDLQTQGADSRTRPEFLRSGLRSSDPGLGGRLATADSTLLERTSAGTDSLRAWVRTQGRQARALYDSAAPLGGGALRWTIQSASALLDRLLTRESSGSAGAAPARFYALRDSWMARTVSWLADSLGRSRKVIAWLHNDHARYTELVSPGGPVEAAGGLLRRSHPESVYSLGFFMGGGSVADNSRRVRGVATPPEESIETELGKSGLPAGYLLITGSGMTPGRVWANGIRRYLRAGLTVDSLVPAEEFDGLVYVRTVRAPSYRLP
ncbi:MAG TPA: erythromycin esterase family protein [Gemmatimonadales bacterium]|nr:erythromycin esterase family protein [Gemmatimonadales bacterium]